MRISEMLFDTIGYVERDRVQFLCIGTPDCAGDAFGPLVGSLLEERGYDVVGTVNDPLTSLNWSEREIEFKHDRILIAVDASVYVDAGYRDGDVEIFEGGLYPGRGIEKDVESVGDYGIHCCVTHQRDTSEETLDALFAYDFDEMVSWSESFVREFDAYMNRVGSS